MCFSTVARAFAATGFVKITEIGMATPTVVPVCGVIVSSSIGGPAGFVGDGEALALGFPCALASSPLALSLPPPPQALAPTSITLVTNAIPMPPLRRPTICPALSLFGPDGPDSLSDNDDVGRSCVRRVKRVSRFGAHRWIGDDEGRDILPAACRLRSITAAVSAQQFVRTPVAT
jgi:hypothetical protein